MAMAGGGHGGKGRVSLLEWVIMLIVSAALISLSWFHIWPLPLMDVMGFATGGICGWLVVRQDILNWPIGLANFLFFAVIFDEHRLYADVAVQIIFFALSLYGWVQWLKVGAADGGMPITRVTRKEWISLAIILPVFFGLLVVLLDRLDDASPDWDAVTSILSLAAQFLLTRKRLENWYFWICAQSIYIPLYISRDLPLMALLYTMFLGMCIYGLVTWRKQWREAQAAAAV